MSRYRYPDKRPVNRRENRLKGNGEPQCAYEDWNGDGYVDLTCHFVDNPENWEPGEGIATLTGKLLDGTPFSGTDALCIVP